MNPSNLSAAVTTATPKSADAAAHNIWSMEAPSGKDEKHESNVKTQDVAAQTLSKNDVRKGIIEKETRFLYKALDRQA